MNKQIQKIDSRPLEIFKDGAIATDEWRMKYPGGAAPLGEIFWGLEPKIPWPIGTQKHVTFLHPNSKPFQKEPIKFVRFTAQQAIEWFWRRVDEKDDFARYGAQPTTDHSTEKRKKYFVQSWVVDQLNEFYDEHSVEVNL